VDYAGEIHRVHVCSYEPCTKVHAVSKQKTGLSAPVHVRLVDQDPADDGHIPAVVGLTTSDDDDDDDDDDDYGSVLAASIPPTPVVDPPPPPFIPVPSTPGADETPQGSPEYESEGSVDVPGPSSPGVQPHPLSDVAAVAPAPGPAFSLAQAYNRRLLAQDVQPPSRGTLLPIPSAVPCPLRETTEPPAEATCKEPTVVGPENSDDEDILLVSELASPAVAEQMNTYLLLLQTDSEYVGISAFMIFALRYRLRVHAWFDMECRDLVAHYAPWATEHITDRPLVDAVSCKWAHGPGLSLHGHAVQSMNHWVACFPDSDAVVYESPDASTYEAEHLFYATYLSVNQRVAKSVTNGDCGLDVMSLILGMPRNLVSRKGLRTELCAFARKHIANRVFIAMLNELGELTVHLGLYELESAGASLMACPLEEALVVANHGDGVIVQASADPPLLTDRDFSAEELSALAWKCRMGKSCPEVLALLLQRLPEECITQLVEVYRTRSTAVDTSTAAEKKNYFIYKRDVFQHHKTKAVKQFLQWIVDTYGEGTVRRIRDTGRLSYGCFVAYARAHTEPERACCLSGKIQK